jgi:hypothetical protein
VKIKESYTLEELCSGLTIPLVKFCQMAGITEATLIRLRKGYAGRQSTLNSILAAFSKVYGIDFDLSNVEGLTLQDKPHQKGKSVPIEEKPISARVEPAPVQKSIVEPKRVYSPRKSDLPASAILASKFAESHGVKRPTFIDHMNIGLGPGLIHGPDVPEDGSVQVKDYVRSEERNKRVRKGGTIEKERYLTADQQRAALVFWKEHQVDYSQCTDFGCWCHTLKQEN